MKLPPIRFWRYFFCPMAYRGFFFFCLDFRWLILDELKSTLGTGNTPLPHQDQAAMEHINETPFFRKQSLENNSFILLSKLLKKPQNNPWNIF